MLRTVKHVQVPEVGHSNGNTPFPVSCIQDLYECPQINIRVIDFGGAENPPLVFLHGTAECAESAGLVAPNLTDIRHVIAYDQRGTAQSSWRGNSDKPYKWSNFIYDLRAVTQYNFGDQKADLIGSSVGGIQAAAYAALMPSLVNSIVLVDTVPGGIPNKIHVLRELAARRYESRDEAARSLTTYGNDELEILLQERDGTWGIHFDHGLLDALPVDLFERAQEFAPHIHCPVLILRGEKSRVFRSEAVAVFKNLLPSTTTLIESTIPKAGHRIMRENPQGFLEATRKFYET